MCRCGKMLESPRQLAYKLQKVVYVERVSTALTPCPSVHTHAQKKVRKGTGHAANRGQGRGVSGEGGRPGDRSIFPIGAYACKSKNEKRLVVYGGYNEQKSFPLCFNISFMCYHLLSKASPDHLI